MYRSLRTVISRQPALAAAASSVFCHRFVTKNEGPEDSLDALLSSAKEKVGGIFRVDKNPGDESLAVQAEQESKEDISFERIGKDFLDLISGRAEKAAISDIISQVRKRSSQGTVEDQTTLPQIFAMLDTYKEKLGDVANKFLSDIDVFQLTPTALLYFLEREDEIKNPSYKRRIHRFFWGIDEKMMKDLNDALQLAFLSYADTITEVEEGLLQRNYELLSGTVQSEPGKPANFLAAKRDSHVIELVLLVRGTRTVADAITDLLCDTVEFRGGKAHSMILQSGKFVVEQHLETIKELQKSGKRLKITCIGHSLGAGAASIAGMELKSLGIPTQVIGFGCPALLSQNLAEETSSYITTVINDDDMVPRMSGISVANVLCDILEFNWIPYAQRDIESALNELNRQNPMIFSEALTKRILKDIGDFMETHLNDLILESPKERVPVELFPPGRCLHFYRDGVGFSGCIVPNNFFSSIDVSRRMLDDHVFHTGYVKTFLDVERQRTGDWHFRFEERQ